MRKAKGYAKMGRRGMRERVHIFIGLKRAVVLWYILKHTVFEKCCNINVPHSTCVAIYSLVRSRYSDLKLDLISSLNVTETCSVMSGVSITTGTKSTGPDTEKKINICDTQLGQCQKAIMVSL